MNPHSEMAFVDSIGKQYLIRDVLGNGDCALLALLHSPGFEAPVSGATELRRGIVSFARGQSREACSRVYALVGEKNETTFNMYLTRKLDPGFWVGTVAFVWATMAYKVEIKTHFFNDKGKLDSTSTTAFLRRHIPGYEEMELEENKTVHVFFHQYNQMKCKPAMNNHFAMMVLVRPMLADTSVTLNREVEQFNNPWWLNNANTETTEDSKVRKPKKTNE